jgi:hypothetical protein
MQSDLIASVQIDDSRQLHVVPSAAEFPRIYWEAMDVHWDPDRRSLHSPPPREWSYVRWFEQIIEAASRQGINLELTGSTQWIGVQEEVREALLAYRPNK